MPLQRRIVWTAEPEMLAWVRDNDGGRPLFEVARDFADRFGTWPTRTQLSQARSWLGIRTRPPRGKSTREERPVGYERESKDGYIVVKVADRPKRPGSKDNWKLKQVHEWEFAHGEELPRGWVVYFADHDFRNFAPDNLVAVPRRLVVQVNQRSDLWHDRATLEAVVALCELNHAVVDAKAGPRRCKVCGTEFVPTPSQRWSDPKTCPDCLASGVRYGGIRCGGATATCEVCGREFAIRGKNQRRCHECSARNRGRNR